MTNLFQTYPHLGFDIWMRSGRLGLTEYQAIAEQGGKVCWRGGWHQAVSVAMAEAFRHFAELAVGV